MIHSELLIDYTCDLNDRDILIRLLHKNF